MVEFLCCGLDSKGNTLISKEIQRLEKENQRLKAELNKQIKDDRKLVKAIRTALNYLICDEDVCEDICNEQLAFDELRLVLKEVEED